jgi:hypothetical protein
MKILDIITPDETLNENLKTDAQELAKRAGTKARDVANDVGERFNIKWLRRAESQGVSNHIDQLLTAAGKDLKRSPDLADAERVLLDLEKSVKYDRAGKKQFEEIGDNLADALHAQKEASLGGANIIDMLEQLYKNNPNPPAWMSNRTLQLKRLDDEWLDWMTKSVDAKIVVRREVELAKPLDPKAKPKTKVEKEEEKITNTERETRKKQADLAAKKIDAEIQANTAAEKTFASRFKLTLADEIFIGAEVSKVALQYYRSKKYIDQWEASGQMPEDVAKFFPQVPADLKAGLHITGGDKGQDERTYTNEQQRIKQAASWARTKLAKQVVYQIMGGGIAFVVAQGAVGLGGGIAGGASKYAKAIKLINLMSKKSKSVTDPILKGLAGLTQAGKYMFVDYFLSAVNGEQWNSNDAASAVNAVLPDAVYKDLNISNTADINKAVGSLVAENFTSLEVFGNSAVAQQIKGAFEASYVPLGIIAEPVGGVIAWIWKNFNLPDIDVIPPAGGEIPGVGDPVKPQTTTQTNTVPPVRSPLPANPEVTSTAPPAPANTAEPVTTNNNGIRQRKLDETLKYKVLSRMKS